MLNHAARTVRSPLFNARHAPTPPGGRERPGYVYILENPAVKGWYKIGHTYRPPCRRARELSRTALPLPFSVCGARFFWHAPQAERALQQAWKATRGPRRGSEFFYAPRATLLHHLQELPSPILNALSLQRKKGENTSEASQGDETPEFDLFEQGHPEDAWGTRLEDWETWWSWAEEDCQHTDPARRLRGWQRMAALSALGWGEGSWRLAHALFQQRPSVDSALRASWVMQAAATQGREGARLRALWLASWASEEHLATWIAQAITASHAQGPFEAWPLDVRETWAWEWKGWHHHPDRAARCGALQSWLLQQGATPELLENAAGTRLLHV